MFRRVLRGSLLPCGPAATILRSRQHYCSCRQRCPFLSGPLNGLISYCPASLDANFTCTVPPMDCNSECSCAQRGGFVD